MKDLVKKKNDWIGLPYTLSDGKESTVTHSHSSSNTSVMSATCWSFSLERARRLSVGSDLWTSRWTRAESLVSKTWGIQAYPLPEYILQEYIDHKDWNNTD